MTKTIETLSRLDQEKLSTFDGAHELFIENFNVQNFEPTIIGLNDPGSKDIIKEFEETDSIIILPQGGEKEMYLSLSKLMERFVPETIGLEKELFESKLIEFAMSKGIIFTEDEKKSGQENLLEALKTHGSVGYFPNSITTQGKIAVERIRYFSKEIQDEITAASEGPLSPEETKKSINNSVLVSVGLSVGSEMALGAMQKGIMKFVFADPGKLHADLMGRLGLAFDNGWIGVNKSLYLKQAMLKLNPYLDIQVFAEGLNTQNYQEIINEKWLTPDMQSNGGMMYVAEEADSWNAKMMTRKGVHNLPSGFPWHLFMYGDVAHRVTMSHETESDRPFLGFVASADPGGDEYGTNLSRLNETLALFASVGGFNGIPLIMLMLLRDNKIGKHPGAEISRVPQSREATLLAAATFLECVRLIASGYQVSDYKVIDLEPLVTSKSARSRKVRKEEEGLQVAMSNQFFGKPSL